ncbi:MAG: ATP-binding protein [Bacilli bacterium]|nr:ATP-binding protein [Bacilli bacterium]
MIKRELLLEKIKDYKDKDIIKIITGIRRSGKSYLLFEIYYNYLIENGIDKQHIILINLESKKNEYLRDANNLYNYIEQNIIDDKKYYIFIDEIQMVNEFEDVVNGIKTDFNSDLYITGSNSKLLSSDINTKLRGRGIEIKVYPLSFKEYYENAGGDKQKAFNEYIMYGGMPYASMLDKDYEKIEYLKMLNETIGYRDIIEYNNIKNENLFNSLVELLCSQIGSTLSPNKIANTFKSNNFKTVDNETITKYLKCICDSFLFYKVSRYDLKGKKYLKSLNKYYVCDMGLRNEKINFRQIEMMHVLENIVYLELLRRNYVVDIGKNNSHEIDFIARTYNDLYYIQVSLSIENLETKERELSAFKGLDDGYKKIVITMDNNPLIRLENGYKMVNIFDFLLNENILKEI